MTSLTRAFPDRTSSTYEPGFQTDSALVANGICVAWQRVDSGPEGDLFLRRGSVPPDDVLRCTAANAVCSGVSSTRTPPRPERCEPCFLPEDQAFHLAAAVRLCPSHCRPSRKTASFIRRAPVAFTVSHSLCARFATRNCWPQYWSICGMNGKPIKTPAFVQRGKDLPPCCAPARGLRLSETCGAWRKVEFEPSWRHAGCRLRQAEPCRHRDRCQDPASA